jgi:hypothetical protein
MLEAATCMVGLDCMEVLDQNADAVPVRTD